MKKTNYFQVIVVLFAILGLIAIMAACTSEGPNSETNADVTDKPKATTTPRPTTAPTPTAATTPRPTTAPTPTAAATPRPTATSTQTPIQTELPSSEPIINPVDDYPSEYIEEYDFGYNELPFIPD